MVGRRAMPPWLPEPGVVRFRDERRLPAEEAARILAWVTGGAPEGDRAAVPPPPRLPSGWQLGPPDLVLRLPEAYPLAGRGGDVFRNFVLPLPVAAPAWVRAVEFRPGARGRVHHATVLVDATGEARRLDAMDPEPGYAGMEGGVAPDGHFVGWSPGRQPRPFPGGLTWEIRPGMDLVVQLHLIPGPRPERIQPEIGLYLAPRPSPARGVALHLASTAIDIPAGEPAHPVRDHYVVPADVDALAIYPHAHHLCREMTVEAALPDGAVRPLLRIPRWDFDWQDEYEYAEPVFLPAGTTLRMAFVYDNSAANLRNPTRPPRRVRWGSRSSDEMADVWLTVVPRRPAAHATLLAEQERRDLERLVDGYTARLAAEPDDFEARSRLGHILVGEGRDREALPHLEAARRRRPGSWGVLHNLGVAHARRGAYAEALGDLQAAIALHPGSAATHESLGTTLALLGRLEEAVDEYDRALALRPDPDAHNNAGVVLARLGRSVEAERHYRAALGLRPDDAGAGSNLGVLLARLGRDDEAIGAFVAVLAARPDHGPALRGLGAVVAGQAGRPGAAPARAHLEAALAAGPRDRAGLEVHLGLALVALGLLDDAAPHLEAAAEAE